MTKFFFFFFFNHPKEKKTLQTKILIENAMAFNDTELQSRFIIFIPPGSQFLILYSKQQRQDIIYVLSLWSLPG